jgi:hypothetical protein
MVSVIKFRFSVDIFSRSRRHDYLVVRFPVDLTNQLTDKMSIFSKLLIITWMNSTRKVSIYFFCILFFIPISSDCLLKTVAKGNILFFISQQFIFFNIFYKYIRKNNRHLFLIYYYSIKFSGNGFFFKKKKTTTNKQKEEYQLPLKVKQQSTLFVESLVKVNRFNFT